MFIEKYTFLTFSEGHRAFSEIADKLWHFFLFALPNWSLHNHYYVYIDLYIIFFMRGICFYNRQRQTTSAGVLHPAAAVSKLAG